MEYYSNNGNTDSLSITDMIECDIKSGFSESMRMDDPLISSASSLDGNLSSHLSLSRGYSNQNGLTLVSLSHVNEMDIGNGQSDDGSKSDLAWMQTVNLADIQDMIVQVQPENTNPNLLVNPQTGLPVTACQQQLQPQSPNVSTVTITHGTVGTSLLQAQDQVQYIATPVTTIPQSQSQSFIPQNSVPLQTIQNTVSQMSTQMSTSVYPQSSVAHHLLTNNHVNKPLRTADLTVDQKVFPKPVYSYSCLIAMSLKNSDTGALPVSEIYSFMTENFPYFKTAPDGWKNSVRHNLSLNKCFEKIENPKANGNTRKGCLWGLNPAKVEKMDEEIAKWRKKDLSAIKRSMAKPDILDILERGKLGSDSPHHPNNIKNGLRPITGNIDITITRVGTGTTRDAVNTAVSSNPACVTSMARQSDTPQISLIEITPQKFQIKEETIEVINRPGDCIPGEGKLGGYGQSREENCIGGLSNEDFNMLDNHLALDPSLSEFALQNGLWEEFSNDMLHLDDHQTAATSSLNLNLTTAHAVPSSPSASQMAFAAVTSANSASSPLVALLTTNVNGAAGPQTTVTPAGNILISRTISAQT